MAAIVISGFASCEEEQDLIYVTPAASFQILSPQSGEGVILTAETTSNPGLVLTWEDMDYGTETAITYVVEVAANGSDFSAPVSLASTGATFATVTVGALNTAALNLGLTPGVEGAIDVRVKSSLGTQGASESYSNVISYLVTPFELASPAVQNFFLVGAATEHGWENNNGNAPLFRDAENANLYYYTGYFNADGFKVLASLGNWHPQYGAVSEGVLGASGADGSNEPPAITVPSAGYYTFTFNVGDMTYSLVPFDAAGATTFDSVGIIGEATPGGWDADTDMTNSDTNPHLWKLEGVALTDAVVKFRANDSWDLPGNWGGGVLLAGQMTENGSDFQAVPTSGTYDVWFNDLDLRYIFIEQ